MGTCFDLLNEDVTTLLGTEYPQFAKSFVASGTVLPMNRGKGKTRRELDCAVINFCVYRMNLSGVHFDTVRGAFLEGSSVFPGTAISAETHIQIAVRNPDCILGVFRPNL